MYAVVHQKGSTTQRLVAAKARLAKQGLTVPRQELISAHMATNLVTNVRNMLDGLPTPKVYAWLDSTVALHWICRNGRYKQFVDNHVSKIHQQSEIGTCRHKKIQRRRGGQTNELWWSGPSWLANQEKWPTNPVTSASSISEEEAKTTREVLYATQTKELTGDIDQLLEKHDLKRALRLQGSCTTAEHAKSCLACCRQQRSKESRNSGYVGCKNKRV